MNLIEEFHKHAADCEQMAKLTRDAASKAAWRELAERFRQCAEKTPAFSAHVSKRPRSTSGRAAADQDVRIGRAWSRDDATSVTGSVWTFPHAGHL